MILSVIAILLVLIVAYFHFAQKLFSATISMVLVVLSAVFAVSYHETIVAALLKGKYPDYAPGAMLVVLFAATYLGGRFVFDRFVPGNVRLQSTVDGAGAAVVGLVAGVFAVGALMVAAQTMPFGPSIAGYARYPLADRPQVAVPRPGRQSIEVDIVDELRVASFDPARRQSLLLPVDDILIGTVRHLSDGGSLAGPNAMSAVQPAYLDALFGQRLGVQVGATRAALNLGLLESVEVPDGGVAAYARLPQVPGEMAAIVAATSRPPIDPVLIADEARVLLAVRVVVGGEAADPDNLFRVSPAAVRLVVDGEEYRPVGTLEGAAVLVANNLDDPLFVPAVGGAAGVDFVFALPTTALDDPAADEPKVADGAFLEVKRFARVDLSGRPVAARLPPDPAVKVLRKVEVAEAIGKLGVVPAAPAEATVP